MTLNQYITITCIILALIFGGIHIWAEHEEQQKRIYQFKPFALLMILLVAIIAVPPVTSFYKATIILALILSSIGALALMLPGNTTIIGLGHSLIVHLLYIVAFFSQVSLFNLPSPWSIFYIVLGILSYRFLISSLKELKIPASIYMVIILIMAWRAFEMWIATDTLWALSAAVAACLLLISDIVLTFNHSIKSIPGSQGIVLGTYYFAQLLIALSIRVDLGL